MVGVLLLVAAVCLAMGFGLWRRATDGAMRPAGGQPQRVAPVPERRTGARESRPGAPTNDAFQVGALPDDGSAGVGDAAPVEAEAAVDVADLGRALGERATLLQFSSAFCAPCRATRAVLSEVAGMVPGVAHIEIDAESHLDLIRRLDVRRTPTVLVLDPGGRIRRRAVGAPRRADVIAALGEVI